MSPASARPRAPRGAWAAVALIVVLGVLPPLAWAEKVEIVTYYPSPAAATADKPPPKPYTLYIAVPPTTAVAYDVYGALQLWRSGVSQGNVQAQVSIYGWQGGYNPSVVNDSGVTIASWPTGLGYPVVRDGTIMIDNQGSGHGMLKADVTW